MPRDYRVYLEEILTAIAHVRSHAAGMTRDVHAYSSVDLDIVWDVVENKLPALEPQVRVLLEQ